MNKPTIFISHSTRGLTENDATVSLRKALSAELDKRGWRVFVDETISAGAKWRKEILYYLATCQAAIILLNKNACESEWVKQESLILSFRKSQSPRFALIPVVCPGVTDVDLEEFLKSYEPFQLNEIQRKAVKPETGQTIQETVNEVAKLFEPERVNVADNLMSPWMEKVRDILECLDVSPLRRATDVAKIDAEHAISEDHLHTVLVYALTQYMHHVPPEDSIPVVDALLTHLNARNSAANFGNYIFMQWIENESIEILLHAAQNSDKELSLTINTSKQYIYDLYKCRANLELPMGVDFISISDPVGDLEENELFKQIEREIAEALYISSELMPDEVACQIRGRWVENKDTASLIICKIPSSYCRKALLERLKSHYKGILFIALVGNNAENYGNGFRPMKPLLTNEKLAKHDELERAIRRVYSKNQLTWEGVRHA